MLDGDPPGLCTTLGRKLRPKPCGSWQRPDRDLPGDRSQNFRLSSLPCHMLLPQTLCFLSKQPVPGRPGSLWGLGHSRESQMAAVRTPGGRAKNRKREERAGKRASLFPPGLGVGSSFEG